MHTRETVRCNLNNAAFVERAIWDLYLGQTAGEKAFADAAYLNGRGFSKDTVGDGTYLARKIARVIDAYKANGYRETDVPWGKILLTASDRFKANGVVYYHAVQVARLLNDSDYQRNRLAA